MKYFLLIFISIYSYYETRGQEIINEIKFGNSYLFQDMRPQNAIKINDSTLCFACFASDGVRIIACDKEFNQRWVVEDSSNFDLSSYLGLDNNKISFHGILFKGISIKCFYRNIYLKDNGVFISRFTPSNDDYVYGFPCLTKTIDGCILLHDKSYYSEIIKYDSSNVKTWRKNLDTAPNNKMHPCTSPLISDNKLISIDAAKDDKIGYQSRHIYFLRTDLSGNIEIEKIYGGFKSYVGITSTKKINDNLFVNLSSEEDTVNKTFKPRLLFFNKDGDSLYCSLLGEGTGECHIKNINVLNDGNILMYGYYSMDYPDSANQFYAAKVDKNGSLIWKKIWGNYNSNDQLYTCVEMESGIYTLIGVSNTLLYKCVIDDRTNSVNEKNQENSRIKISPNPAENRLIIESEEFIKEIEIYNVKGEKLGVYPYSNEIDISNLSSGAYIIKAKTNSDVLEAKFIKK